MINGLSAKPTDPLNFGTYVVGDTGIEPVTPTVSR
jgi:hypothetical protein